MEDTLIPVNPILQGASVSELIPQESPIEMVDTLWFNDDKKTISGFTILESNMFCRNGVFTEPGLIENIAQTAALRLGYQIKQMQKDGIAGKPPLGYIGAIKKLRIHSLPPVGSRLFTEVTVQQIVFDVTLIYAKTMVNDEMVSDCEMKIFVVKQD